MLWTDLDRFGSFIDPWRSFERLNRAGDGLLPAAAAEFPAVNVWADGDNATADSGTAGHRSRAVDISVMGKSSRFKASRRPEEIRDGESYHRRERWYGQFNRTIDLPYTIDAAQVQAKFNRGVLHLTLPRAEEEKPKKIAIKCRINEEENTHGGMTTRMFPKKRPRLPREWNVPGPIRYILPMSISWRGRTISSLPRTFPVWTKKRSTSLLKKMC